MRKKLLRYNLTKEEYHNPISIIKDWYENRHLKGHLKAVRLWRDLAITSNVPETNVHDFSPGNLIYYYQCTVKFMEGAWLLRKSVIGKFDDAHLTPELLTVFIKSENKKIKYFPPILSDKEIIEPCRVFKDCFKKLSLKMHKEILDTWLLDAFVINVMQENMDKDDMITVYENLQRCIVAAWLIHDREIKNKA